MGQCCSNEEKGENKNFNSIIDPNIPHSNFAIDFSVDEIIRFREISSRVNRRYGDFKSDKEVSKDYTEIPEGKKIIEDGSLYSGSWSKGMMWGFGNLLEKNDDFYTGEFIANKKDGRGRLIIKSLESNKATNVEYIGEFKDNKRSGKGKIVFEASHYYDGDWEDDAPHGVGKEYWMIDGKAMAYEGNFVNGRKEGFGRIDMKDEKSYYEGHFLDNCKHGLGKCIWGDGRLYEGEWMRNEMDGEGIFKYADGSIYKGEFKNGKKEGMGEYKWADNIHSYKGDWKDGKRNGYGVLYKEEVGELFGEWKNDEFVKK